MTLMRQEDLGRCDFIDVLEEAVLTKKPVAVKLTNGESFIDKIQDVVTQGGHDYVDFQLHDRVRVSEIVGMTRAEPSAASDAHAE